MPRELGLPRACCCLQDRDHAVTERTVQIGMATYTDVNGARRIGQAGETVDVAADDIERFDRINGPAPEPKPAVQKKAAPVRKKATPQKRAVRRK